MLITRRKGFLLLGLLFDDYYVTGLSSLPSEMKHSDEQKGETKAVRVW
jgi:hypothetical protein